MTLTTKKRLFFLSLVCFIFLIIGVSSALNIKFSKPAETNKTTEESTIEVADQKSVIDEQNYVTTEEPIEEEVTEEENVYQDGWINKDTNVKMFPITSSESIGTLKVNICIHYLEYEYDEEWVIIELYNNQFGYVERKYISDEEVVEITTKISENTNSSYYTSDSSGLTKSKGVNYGPSGKETYYNLDMSGVVSIMRGMGNEDEYWVREDGCKMLGDYIMVAADLNEHPRGSLVETSLGTGIVCDTGAFATNGSDVSIDIATGW
jgi:hypothetical protein